MSHHHDYGCECHHHHTPHDTCYHRGYHIRRHFLTKEEMIKELEEYLEQIKAEARGVEERISQLKKESEA